MPFKRDNKFGTGRGNSCKQELKKEPQNVESRKRKPSDRDLKITVPKKKSKTTGVVKRKTLDSNCGQEIKSTKCRKGRLPPRQEYAILESLKEHGILAPSDPRRKSLQAENVITPNRYENFYNAPKRRGQFHHQKKPNQTEALFRFNKSRIEGWSKIGCPFCHKTSIRNIVCKCERKFHEECLLQPETFVPGEDKILEHCRHCK